jgi:ankyrin repeat protein
MSVGEEETEIAGALQRGDPDEVAALIAAGADIRYRRPHGYDALLAAVHGRDVYRDPRLLDLLRVLIASGAPLDGVSSHQESGLRVLSCLGRFDAVQLLLDAGAPETQLAWTPLIAAVAQGSLEDVRRLLDEGAALEETDWWKRTAWLVALLAGDRAKAELLRDRGANVDARGCCGRTPLAYAIEGSHSDLVRWLLAEGQAVDQTDDFSTTPLMCAVANADLECVDVLVRAGANVEHRAPSGTVLGQSATKGIVERLLEAGADPRHLSQSGQRVLCGLAPDARPLTSVSPEEFERARTRRFGGENPERMREPFWEAMIRAGVSGYEAAEAFDKGALHAGSPVWSAMRYGQSITTLGDGRVVQIAGEHEDGYDPDFCIYNDVFVHGADGSIDILGYPEDLFPPTDFHTATLADGGIYVIGSLGYFGARRYGETPLYRLDLRTFGIERLVAGGEAPGWIHDHRAHLTGAHEIRVSGGTIVGTGGSEETFTENTASFLLDLERLSWRREG